MTYNPNTWNSTAPSGVCPGCGRCHTCGHTAPPVTTATYGGMIGTGATGTAWQDNASAYQNWRQYFGQRDANAEKIETTPFPPESTK